MADTAGTTFNSHVLKYYRWQHFLAEKTGRYLAMCVWATLHNQEAGYEERSA